MATDTHNLIQWLLDLLNDDNAKQDFLRDPNGYLQSHGYGDVSSGDLYDSLCLIHDGDTSGYRGGDNDDDDDNDHHRPHHNGDHESAANYLKTYITNVTNIDDRDTNIDNSVHQRIDTDGGDFDQHIDNTNTVASGDGSTAVGGDNNGNISSAGHDSNTAFGSGDATNSSFDGSHFGAGSAVNVGDGTSQGHAEANTDLDVRDSGNETRNDDHSVDVHDSGNSSHESNDDHSNSHNDLNSHNDTHVDDVHVHP